VVDGLQRPQSNVRGKGKLAALDREVLSHRNCEKSAGDFTLPAVTVPVVIAILTEDMRVNIAADHAS
jgi:hypothetical protein